MTRSVLAPVLLCAALAAGVPARAEELDLSVTHSTTAETRIDNQNGDPNDDNFGILINRINLDATAGDLAAHLRLDSTTFYERPTPAGLPYKNDLRLERFRAEYHLGDFKLLGGDFYRQLGRGIILSLRKENEVGVDVTIRGGEVSYTDDNHQVGLFGGVVNPVNLDSVSQKNVRDTEDVMAGGEYRFSGLDGFELGAHALFSLPRVSILPPAQDWSQSAGLFFEAVELGDFLSIYAELDGQYRVLAEIEQWGVAGYLTADAHFGDTSLLLEGIYLNGFEQLGSPNTALGARTIYNRPPTLQRIREEVVENKDVAGGRLKVEHYLESLDLALFGNGMLRFAGEQQEVLQLHGWGGGEIGYLEGAGHLNLTVGYRHELQGGAAFKSMVHFYVDWIHPVGDGFAIHASTDSEFRSRHDIDLTLRADGTEPDIDYWRGSTFLGLEKSGIGTLTFEFGYDTRESNPNQVIRKYFFAGILGLEVSQALKLNVVGGTQRGGLKCVAGVCREYPAFAGARVEVVGRW